MQIFRNLKPYWKSVIIIALLLVVQAYCDLSLPDYTSKLIDTGIQNYGIEHCSPKQIPEKAYRVIGSFMENDEKTVWESYYKDGSDGYYYLSEDGENHIDELDSACMKGLMMYYYPYQMVNSDEDNEIKAGLAKMGMTLDDMPEQMWAQIGEQMKPTVDGMFDSLGADYMKSTAIACTKVCYDSFGYDYKAGQMTYLKWAAVKMLGMALVMAAAAVLIGLVASRVAAGIGCTLREKVFDKVISFSDAEINKFSTASLITRSTNDVQQIQMVTVMLLRMILYAPILSIGGIIKVVETGAGMGWVIFIGIAAVLILMITLMVIAMPKFKIMQTLVDRVNLVSREILTGIPVIRAFGREKREEERFDEANKDLTKNTLFVNRVMTFAMPILMFIMYAISILIEWVAAHKIDAGVLQVGAMTAFITYTMLIIMSFLMLSMMSVMLPRASVAADRIQEIIDTEVSMVLQDTWLFKGTIMENIRYGRLDATDEEVIEAAKAAHAHRFISALPGGYNMELNEEITNISQGQKQLLTIARAILADNPVLILDEATSSVDTRTEHRIQRAMDNLMKGRTSFVIAHRLSTIKNADIILVMKDGDIIEQGNHEELMAQNGFYADLYNSQWS